MATEPQTPSQDPVLAFIGRNRAFGAAFLVVVMGTLAWRPLTQRSQEASYETAWESYRAAVPTFRYQGRSVRMARYEDLAEARPDMKDTPAEPWFLLELAGLARRNERSDAALEVIGDLEARYSGHPVVTSGAVAGLRAGMAVDAAWADAHPQLFLHPQPPADAVRLTLETDLGTVVLALRADQAPAHVEALVAAVRDGQLDGTRLAKTQPGAVHGGDLRTRNEDRSTWSADSDPVEGIAWEPSSLSHFAGAVSMAPLEGSEPLSHPTRFSLVLEDQPWLDRSQVVVGTITEGLRVLEALADGPAAEDGYLETPAVITAATVSG